MAAPVAYSRAEPELDQREVSQWKWTSKAWDRFAEHPFTAREVMAAVLHPQTCEPGQNRGTERRQRGAVVVVVDPEERLVITIMDALYATRRARPSYPDRIVATVRPAVVAPPERSSAVVNAPRPKDLRDIKNMAERIRLLSAAHSDTVPDVPGDWVHNVCLSRLCDYRERWAVIAVAPYPSVAHAMAQRISEVAAELEIKVSGVQIYARMNLVDTW